jgi:hypothetical protein
MSQDSWADELHADTQPDNMHHDDDPGPGSMRLCYPNVDEFVRGYLLPNWRRPDRHPKWCAKWWEHAEAITRLESLWESWEHLRLEAGTGMATWWRDYADPHMAVLTDPDHGPFKKCDPEKGQHEVLDMWPADPAPEGLFRDGNEEHA